MVTLIWELIVYIISNKTLYYDASAIYEKTSIMDLLCALAVNILGGVAIYGTAGIATPFVAPMLGFGSSGIAASSVAAAAQSYYGNLAAGSIISQLTAAVMVAPTP
ncbi:unnamed protein product [Leptosia nina]|uniref:Uncharacterized protein n=1 Tax=Leptosia nina TaxID=320188 RepID=A0AAV1JR83_9NEOP